MSQWSKAVLGLIGTVLVALVGNIVTVCGPSYLSYGTLPRYVKDSDYKKLDNSFKISDRLDKILLDTDSFYKQRSYELSFLRIRQGKLIQRRKVTTQIYNPFSKIAEVDVSPRLSPDAILKSLVVKDEKGQIKLANQGEDAKAVRVSTAPRTVQLRTFTIDTGKTYTMETETESEVPLSSKEAFVAKKTILGFYEMKIIVDKALRNNLKVSTESLSYECLPETTAASGSEDVTYDNKLTGPIFPGGGFLVEWNYQQ